jgi:hypothetical protein
MQGSAQAVQLCAPSFISFPRPYNARNLPVFWLGRIPTLATGQQVPGNVAIRTCSLLSNVVNSYTWAQGNKGQRERTKPKCYTAMPMWSIASDGVLTSSERTMTWG